MCSKLHERTVKIVSYEIEKEGNEHCNPFPLWLVLQEEQDASPLNPWCFPVPSCRLKRDPENGHPLHESGQHFPIAVNLLHCGVATKLMSTVPYSWKQIKVVLHCFFLVRDLVPAQPQHCLTGAGNNSDLLVVILILLGFDE